MLKAGKRECEVVEPMLQRLATDDDAKAVPVGEIGQAHAARLLDLRENDPEVGAVQGFPMGDSPFQGSPERGADALGMAPGQFVKQRDRAQAGRGSQEWHDLFVPESIQRIGAGSPRFRRFLFSRFGGRGSRSMRRAVAADRPCPAAVQLP